MESGAQLYEIIHAVLTKSLHKMSQLQREQLKLLIMEHDVAYVGLCSCGQKVYQDHDVVRCWSQCSYKGRTCHVICPDCKTMCITCRFVKCQKCLTEGICADCGGNPFCCQRCIESTAQAIPD